MYIKKVIRCMLFSAHIVHASQVLSSDQLEDGESHTACMKSFVQLMRSPFTVKEIAGICAIKRNKQQLKSNPEIKLKNQPLPD